MKESIIANYISEQETILWAEEKDFIPNKGDTIYWLTNKSFYELSAKNKLKKINLNNIEHLSYKIGWGTMGQLLLKPILGQENQLLETRLIDNIKVLYNWVEKQVESIPEGQKESSTRNFVLSNKTIATVPKITIAAAKQEQIKKILNKTLGEGTVDWVFLYEGPQEKLNYAKPAKILGGLLLLGIILNMIWDMTVYIPIVTLILIVLICLYWLPTMLNRSVKWFYGVSKNRIVQVRSDGKKMTHLVIRSIQDIELKPDHIKTIPKIVFKTSRKQITISSRNIGVLEMFKKLIVDLS